MLFKSFTGMLFVKLLKDGLTSMGKSMRALLQAVHFNHTFIFTSTSTSTISYNNTVNLTSTFQLVHLVQVHSFIYSSTPET